MSKKRITKRTAKRTTRRITKRTTRRITKRTAKRTTNQILLILILLWLALLSMQLYTNIMLTGRAVANVVFGVVEKKVLLGIADITINSATLTATAYENATCRCDLFDREFTALRYELKNELNSGGTTNQATNHSYTFQNLTSGTEYTAYVQCYYSNLGLYDSAEISFTTALEYVPFPPVERVGGGELKGPVEGPAEERKAEKPEQPKKEELREEAKKVLPLPSKEAEEIKERMTEIVFNIIEQKKIKEVKEAEKLKEAFSSELVEVSKIGEVTMEAPFVTAEQAPPELAAKVLEVSRETGISEAIKEVFALRGVKKIQASLAEVRISNYVIKSKANGEELTVAKVEKSFTAADNFEVVEIIESIPKTVAASTDNILFTGEQPAIVQKDPLFKWSFVSLKKSETKDLSYFIINRYLEKYEGVSFVVASPEKFPPAVLQIPLAIKMTYWGYILSGILFLSLAYLAYRSYLIVSRKRKKCKTLFIL
ncbi:MAG: hypothetical protein AB1668_02365 [Nanoarchaeota archaeon]